MPSWVSQPRLTARRISFTCAASLIFAVVYGGTGAVQGGPAEVANQAATQPASAISIVTLRGDGHDLGDQQGRQLRDTIRALHVQYLKHFISNESERFAALSAAAIYEAELPPEYRAEVQALAAATGIDERQMMLAQCFLDISPMTACSTITLPASAAADGVARFGRNLDFPSFNIADKTSLLLVYHPTGKYAFAAVSWPGMMGVLSGMNEHGLCLANMEVSRSARWPSALPYTLLYRSVLEQCKTVDEALAFLEKSPRQTANNLMLMDAGGHRAVAEITPAGVHVRSAPDTAPLVCTNHQRGDDLDTPGRCPRYDRLNTTAKAEFGSISAPEIEKMLASTAQGDFTLQSMIFEPQNRKLLLATGKNAPTRPFFELDLAPLFK